MSGLPNVQENNEQILNDIQALQQMEQQLFSNLESNPNLSSTQQQEIIEKMNQLSNMRINLYQTLSGVNNYFETAVNTTTGTLQEQEVAIGIVENELNQAKKRLQILEEEKNNKIRLVEINTYFGDKYAEHSVLMKIIIFTLIPVIVLAFLNNKGILPNTIYYILLVIVSVIGAYFFWNRFASIIARDNMNYQEYDWGFDPNSAPTGSTGSSSDPWATGSNLGTCVGDACCSSGLTYDASMNQCVTSSTSTTESFITESMANAAAYKKAYDEHHNNHDNKNNKKPESFITESMVNQVLTKKDPNNNYRIQYNLRQPEAFNNYR
jgi:hypothetical protein